MSKIINTEVLKNGVVILTMTNRDINNNVTWLATKELTEAIQENSKKDSNIFILASGLNDHWFEHAWLQDILAIYEGRETTAPGIYWFHLMKELTNPDNTFIAAINGRASGGGAEIGWACDLRVAEKKAIFCQPEVDLNLTTGLGGVSRMSRLIGATHTSELVLTGSEFSAKKMYELGAINNIVNNGESLEFSINLANTLSKKPKEALSSLKKILKDSMELPLMEALRNEQEIFQSIVKSDNAIKKMREIQDQYFNGKKPKDIKY